MRVERGTERVEGRTERVAHMRQREPGRPGGCAAAAANKSSPGSNGESRRCQLGRGEESGRGSAE